MKPHPLHRPLTLRLQPTRPLAQPYLEGEVWAELQSPDGDVRHYPGFYAGDAGWLIRVSPDQAGDWSGVVRGRPRAVFAEQPVAFTVSAKPAPQALRPWVADRKARWGFTTAEGDVPLPFGDTLYNLFGMHHAGLPVAALLEKRKAQGFDLFRTRVQVSPYHPYTPFSTWMKSDSWCWGGSPQSPDFTRFNQAYFTSVDQAFALAAKLGVGFELILEAWLMEFPFNQRDRFLPEHEELFVRYVVARYGAEPALRYWCVANEYNLYRPSNRDPLNEHYARRLARLIRSHDAHRRPVATHVTAAEHLDVPFAERFRDCPEIDLLLMQYWGDISTRENAALALGIEDELARSCDGADQPVVFSEYGYEVGLGDHASPEVHSLLGPDHNRRGALRSLFKGYGINTGFDNTWGPIFKPEADPAGAAQFAALRRLFERELGDPAWRPDASFITQGPDAPGHRPLGLALPSGKRWAVYLPAGGVVGVKKTGTAQWWHPATGKFSPARPRPDGRYQAPTATDAVGLPSDWVLLGHEDRGLLSW